MVPAIHHLTWGFLLLAVHTAALSAAISDAEAALLAVKQGIRAKVLRTPPGPVTPSLESMMSLDTRIELADSKPVAMQAGDGQPVLVRWGNTGGPDLPGIVAVSGGWEHACAITLQGTVQCWDDNTTTYGQADVPLAVSAGTATLIHCNLNFSMAVLSDGSLHTWGQRSTPVLTAPATLTNPVAIVTGLLHGAALDASGKITMWGLNNLGQTTQPPALAAATATQISAGLGHTLALTSDGQVFAWGYNNQSQVTIPLEAQSGVIAIGAGPFYSMAVKSDGTIVAWGDTTEFSLDPPTGLTGVTAVATGGLVAMALVNGGVVQWGSKNVQAPATVQAGVTSIAAGLLAGFAIKGGTGSQPPAAPPPMPISSLTAAGDLLAWGYKGDLTGPLSNVVEVSGGNGHMCALQNNNRVTCYGDDDYGQATVPAQVNMGTPKLVVAGANYSMAVMSDNTLITWGQTDNSAVIRAPPTLDAVMIGCGFFHCCAVQTNNTITCWGDNGVGQLDVPPELNPPISPVTSLSVGMGHNLVVAGGTVYAWGWNKYMQSNVPVTAQSGVISVAAGAFHSLALKSDGTIVAFGYDFANQTDVPSTLASVSAIAAGREFSLALSDGRVYAWGFNGNGQTTVPTAAQSGVTYIAAGGYTAYAVKSNASSLPSPPPFTPSPPPGPVVGTAHAWGDILNTTIPGVVDVCGAYFHWCALSAAGKVTCEGDNSRGQTTVPLAVSSGVVKQLTCNVNYTMVLMDDGTVKTWGDPNLYAVSELPTNLADVAKVTAGGGQAAALLKNGSVVVWGTAKYNIQQYPPEVAAGGIVDISCGAFHCMVLTSTGSVIAWGYPQLGITIVPLGAQSGVTAISAGLYFNLALKADGTVVAWGENTYGETTMPELPPIQAISAGGFHSLVLDATGRVWTWGNTAYGLGTVPRIAQSGVATIKAGTFTSFAITPGV